MAAIIDLVLVFGHMTAVSSVPLKVKIILGQHFVELSEKELEECLMLFHQTQINKTREGSIIQSPRL